MKRHRAGFKNNSIINMENKAGVFKMPVLSHIFF